MKNLTYPGADIRKDIPLYRVLKEGKLHEETTDIGNFFDKDMVTFLLGCSFGFENALMAAGVPVRNIEEGKNISKNISMYLTNRACVPAGRFSAPLVMTMRPIPDDLVTQAVRITARYPMSHGAPIHIGDEKTLGIKDLDRPEFGDAVTINRGETPVFWACGVTSSVAVLSSKPEICITHAPGHMFVTDLLNETLAVS